MGLVVNYTLGPNPTNKPLQTRQNVGNVQFSSDQRVGSWGDVCLGGISGNMEGFGGSLD